MSQSAERVLRFLTDKNDIEDVSIADLLKLTDESPFFPVAQLLLSKKLKAENHTDYLSQAQKTALYFSNPFLLHFQLENKRAEVLADNDVFNAESQITDKQDAAAKEDSVETEKINLAEKELHAEKNADQPAEEMAAITREPNVTTELFLNEALIAEEISDINNNKDSLPKIDNSANSGDAEVVEEMAEASKETDDFPGFFSEDEQTAPTKNAQQPLVLADNDLFDNDFLKVEKESTEQDEHEKMFQNIKAMLDATSEEADADTNNAVVPIDPYYTIDYFAAQGIKLELDPNPKDELGKHLKKFTQWLKQMKKLGPEDATEVISRRETEADIQKIADSSNTAREVVTEAMASVLEKQGKKEKAIELYDKLSFLNPDKSAYFAVKIKNLKGS